MKYETLKLIRDCKTEEEARMKCDIIGDVFDKDEYDNFSIMEEWNKTLYLYRIDCEERGVVDVL